jgi:hypothetical protein
VSAPMGHLQVDFIYWLIPKELLFCNGCDICVVVTNCVYIHKVCCFGDVFAAVCLSVCLSVCGGSVCFAAPETLAVFILICAYLTMILRIRQSLLK